MSTDAAPPRHPSDENWVPRCPACAQGQVLLAPANQYTRLIPDRQEAYCPNCRWRGRLDADGLARIFVRL